MGSLRKNKIIEAKSPQPVNKIKSLIYPDGLFSLSNHEASGFPNSYTANIQHQV